MCNYLGLYPLIGWKRKEIVYILEGACHDCGTILDWAQRAGTGNIICVHNHVQLCSPFKKFIL